MYDLIEVGLEHFKRMDFFTYDKKLAPQAGSNPFIVFRGEAFESVDESKHLTEVLLDVLRSRRGLFLLPFAEPF